jgi:hypothetical protein
MNREQRRRTENKHEKCSFCKNEYKRKNLYVVQGKEKDKTLTLLCCKPCKVKITERKKADEKLRSVSDNTSNNSSGANDNRSNISTEPRQHDTDK